MARVVVIGAGLGGLAATAHLLGGGHDVTVVERDHRPGGRAGLIERAGFRLDNGPTVLTMPGLLGDVFAAAGADMADHLDLRPVDPMYRAVYADGSPAGPQSWTTYKQFNVAFTVDYTADTITLRHASCASATASRK